MRDRRLVGLCCVLGVGLIPAGAGQTAGGPSHIGCRTAHPRGCGADNDFISLVKVCQGSFPRVRGRLTSPSRCRCAPGLIPAGAGQTLPHFVATTRPWAHPRGCGADYDIVDTTRRDEGSSPRVRGRPFEHLLYLIIVGLIPAGAGQTRA